ncbi:MAG: GTPase HflX [Candidatus Omnitrophota bacterium]|nr:GTPase HflX [Candidatus Omnitrophota bacterium]
MLADLVPAERALLVAVRFKARAHGDPWPASEIQSELKELVLSSGLEAAEEILLERDRPSPATLIGSGQAERIRDRAAAARANVVIFGADLSFAQQNNLEDEIGLKVIDRTQLILDIFAHRAHSNEGKVQVELAQLRYLLPRLAGKGILLSRLGGGIGTSGPGEQKLEMDRRRIRLRINRLARELEEIRRRRETAREKRRSEEVPVAVLVGYTNAGKSTLLNALTGAGARTADSLFTTLDPLTRRLPLPDGQGILLTDTVGFLHRLPHHLIEAFRATLQEAAEASLLLHVMDASSLLLQEKESAVHEVLQDLGADNRPILQVLNKTDLLQPGDKEKLRRLYPEGVLLSARTGEGFGSLKDRLLAHLGKIQREALVRIPRGEEAWLSRIYREGAVLERQDQVRGIKVRVRVPLSLYGQLKAAGYLKLSS